MTYVIGVDGGGTRTRAALVDFDGREIGRGEGPGAVATVHDPDAAASAVLGAIRIAIADAGVVLPATALWAGLAGAGSEPARTAVLAALTLAGPAKEIVIGSDAEAAFNDAFDGEGVMLIAGTGSVGWYRSPAGDIRRVGGWGKDVGDEGSGFAIGRAALALVARAFDGRAEATTLSEPLLARCGAKSVHDLIDWAGGALKSEVASLAPLVLEGADAGDPGCLEIAEAAVDALEEHLLALDLDAGQEIALWGGLIAGNGPLRPRLVERIEARGWTPVDRPIDPPIGAARLALEMARA